MMALLSALAWAVPLTLLLAPAYRLARQSQRSLDALWGVLLLGVANRLWSDFGGAPAPIARLSAILMAAMLAAVIWSYQRADS